MTKTEIAKLVAVALEAEFERQQQANEQHSESLKNCLHPMPLPEAKPRPTPEDVLALEKLRRWHLSFQERRMAREDAAWMLLGHKVKPLPETKPTPEDEFKIERLSWWLFLFEGRIALGDAAGLLLGFSWTMTEDAKFVDAHKSNPRAPRLMSNNLVDAFTDMRGYVEVALQKKELFSDRDGRINSIDLIEWAKEKGYVADEVLAAWGAYNQSEAGEAGQAGAPAKAESKPGDAWKAEALEKAKNIIARQGEKGLHPNLQIIADEIAKDWRSQRKHGPKGTPLTGAYIKRHALQGTGIAIDRSSIISA